LNNNVQHDILCVWQWYNPLEGTFANLHLLIFQDGSESGVVDSVPVAKVKILVDGFVEFAFGKLLSILGQLFVVKLFGDILRKIGKVVLRQN
jgi:hypothetical protein